MPGNLKYNGKNIAPVWGISIGANGSVTWSDDPANINYGNVGEILTSAGPNNSPEWTSIVRTVTGTDGITVNLDGSVANIAWSPGLQGTGWSNAANIAPGDIFLGSITGSAYLKPGQTFSLPYATNTSVWIQKSTGTIENLNSMTGTPIRMIAGSGGTVLVSPDALNWQQQAAPTLNNFNGVTYSSGSYVIVGEAGAVVRVVSGEWQYRISNLATTVNFNSVTSSGDTFIIVGDQGSIFLSTNQGLTWTPQDSGVTNDLLSIDQDGGEWLVGGRNGTLLQGNTAAWATASVPTPGWLYYHGDYATGAYFNGLYIIPWRNNVAGNYPNYYTSPDGINWTWRTGFGGQINALGANTTVCVAVGPSGRVETTQTGVSWTVRDAGAGTNELYSARYLGNRWYITGQGGNVRVSTDTVTWDRINSSSFARLRDIAWNGENLYVIVGDLGTVLSSNDGNNWEPKTTSSGTTNNITRMINVNRRFYALDSGGAVRTTTTANTWVVNTTFPGQTLREIVYSGGYFVITGDSGFIATSQDGNTWTRQVSGTSRRLDSLMTDDAGTWVAAGKGLSSWGDYSPPVVRRNINNGNSWQWINRTSSLNITSPVVGAVMGQSRLMLAVSDGSSVYRSTDFGNSWNEQLLDPDTGFTNINKTTTGSYQYVITTRNGNLWASTGNGSVWNKTPVLGFNQVLNTAYFDSPDWVALGTQGVYLRDSFTGTKTGPVNMTSRTTGPTSEFTQIIYENDQWVIVGKAGLVMTSDDGLEWRRRNITTSISTGQTYEINGIAYGVGVYVAIADNGGILYAALDDLDNWFSVIEIVPDNLYCINFINGIFYVGGGNGLILTSTDGKTWFETRPFGTQAVTMIKYLNNLYLLGTGAYYPVLPSGSTGAGVLYVSSEFGNWTQIFTNSAGRPGTWTNAIYRPEFGWIVSGTAGKILVSKDTYTWTEVLYNRFNSASLNVRDLAYAEEHLIAVCGSEPASPGQGATLGQVINSNDGNNWHQQTRNILVGMNSAATDGAQVYIAGQSGLLAVPGSVTDTIFVENFNNTVQRTVPPGTYRFLGGIFRDTGRGFFTRIE